MEQPAQPSATTASKPGPMKSFEMDRIFPTPSASADFHSGKMHDSGPWAPRAIVSGEVSEYSTPVPKLKRRGMKSDQWTDTCSTSNDRTTTTHQTAPTSTCYGSETGGDVNDQTLVNSGSNPGVVDRDPIFLEKDKPGVGALSSTKGKGPFNPDWVKGVGQNEVLLADQKESLGRFFFEIEQEQPSVDTRKAIPEQPKSQSTIHLGLDDANGYSTSRDIESQEIQNRPTRPTTRAGLLVGFILSKLLIILRKILIKPFYPSSNKKARRLVALTTIVVASTAVTLLRRAGNSVSDMSISVIAISALGTIVYNVIADSSTPLQE